MSSRFHWYTERARYMTDVAPEKAHLLASAQAAAIAAKLINSKATGELARDVSTPKRIGVGHTLLGSNKVYAAAENFGATIRARPGGRMLIRGTRGGTTRSTTGGDIVASATEVRHHGKHFLEAAVVAFPRLYVSALRRML